MDLEPIWEAGSVLFALFAVVFTLTKLWEKFEPEFKDPNLTLFKFILAIIGVILWVSLMFGAIYQIWPSSWSDCSNFEGLC